MNIRWEEFPIRAPAFLGDKMKLAECKAFAVLIREVPCLVTRGQEEILGGFLAKYSSDGDRAFIFQVSAGNEKKRAAELKRYLIANRPKFVIVECPDVDAMNFALDPGLRAMMLSLAKVGGNG